MLMKCKTCTKELVPPRKNISTCSKCIIFKAKNQPEGASIKEESESEENKDSN